MHENARPTGLREARPRESPEPAAQMLSDGTSRVLERRASSARTATQCGLGRIREYRIRPHLSRHQTSGDIQRPAWPRRPADLARSTPPALEPPVVEPRVVEPRVIAPRVIEPQAAPASAAPA